MSKLRKFLAIQVDPADSIKFSRCYWEDESIQKHLDRNRCRKTGYTLGDDTLMVFYEYPNRYVWTRKIERWLIAHNIKFWTDEVWKRSW